MNLYRGMVGNYQIRRPCDDPDVLIMNSFGTVTNPWGVNARIKAFAARIAYAHKVPVITDARMEETYGSLPPGFVFVVDGPISNRKGEGFGTFDVLEGAKGIMDAEGLTNPMLVGQACHVHRTALQAMSAKIKMDPIVPKGLPYQFDSHSEQIWTRSLPLWIAHEVIGAQVLRKRGQL